MLCANSVGDEIGIDEDVVGRTESGVGRKEHVRRGLRSLCCEFVFRLLFFGAGRGVLHALIALFDGAFHLAQSS